ncbi:hypothetical protein SAY86_032178 [Trapa natans]|uniref:Cyclin-dependent kinase inhibitor domain-containing protein n=1 Tax=Trapa natans TaxID=22666 RepID=A0AAN7R873_TRANT|nr:hypothetical protein SAY86_032178 [Trapa natans]
MVEEGEGNTEVAMIDHLVAPEVRPQAQPATMDSSAAAAGSNGVAKRRRTENGENQSLKFFSNDSTCIQHRSDANHQNSASATPVSLAVGETFHYQLSTNFWASDSCCSSNGSSEVEKDRRFADLEEDCGEADSSAWRFSRERREKMPSSEAGGEELDSMNAPVESTPPERTELQSSNSTMLHGRHGKIGKSEIKRPSDFEIEEFFAAAEADNILDLEHFKSKYNFDFIKEEPLKGRFEWHHISSGGNFSE